MGAGRIKYTTRLANEICKAIRNGDTLAEIAARDGMPSVSTILRWSRENEEFKKKYADACIIKVNLWCEERDELSKADPMLPMEVAKKYDLLQPVRCKKTGRYERDPDGKTIYKYDDKLLLACMRQEEAARKLRIDVLNQNINKLAAIYDEKFKDTSATDLAKAAAAGASAGLSLTMMEYKVPEKDVTPHTTLVAPSKEGKTKLPIHIEDDRDE